MAQRRSPRGKSVGKTSKAKPKAAKRAKAKPALKSAASKSKAVPKRAAKARKPQKVSKAPAKAKARAAKLANTSPAKLAKISPAKPAPANSPKADPHQSRSPVERRRQRGPKGRRAPAFERAPALAAETRGDDYVYERDTARTGETNDTYTPGNLVPGQVGEARTARSNGGRRAVARPRDSETETVTVESGAEAARATKGGFDEGQGGQRESEIAGVQGRDGADTQPPEKQDYGRPKTSDGKLTE